MTSRVEVTDHKTLPRCAARAAAGLLVFALVAPAACGRDSRATPKDVAIKWRTADLKGDFETSWPLEAPELAGPAEQKAATIAGRRERFKPVPPGHEVTDIEAIKTVEDETQKEDFVFVYLRVTKREYGSDDEVVTLRRVDGDWRVAKWEP